MTTAIQTIDSATLPGKVIAVRGSVVDLRFEENLPSINTVVRTGADEEIILEVQMHLDNRSVRCIALTPTQSLARGIKAIATDEPRAKTKKVKFLGSCSVVTELVEVQRSCF